MCTIALREWIVKQMNMTIFSAGNSKNWWRANYDWTVTNNFCLKWISRQAILRTSGGCSWWKNCVYYCFWGSSTLICNARDHLINTNVISFSNLFCLYTCFSRYIIHCNISISGCCSSSSSISLYLLIEFNYKIHFILGNGIINGYVVSQMYISRTSSEAKRISDLSQLNALNDMGMVFGSSVGGIVTSMFG